MKLQDLSFTKKPLFRPLVQHSSYLHSFNIILSKVAFLSYFPTKVLYVSRYIIQTITVMGSSKFRDFGNEHGLTNNCASGPKA
jgi:hypothetical protein